MPRTANTASTRSTKSRQPVRSTRTVRSRKKDAFALLQDDHKRVQKMFKQFAKTDREDSDAMRELVEEACHELEVHALLEEQIFYPALREMVSEDQAEMLEEAEIEHDSAKQLIAALRELQPGDSKYAATFIVLGEYVKHHIEEEESEIFKQAKKAKLDLDALGEQLQNRRKQLMEDDEASGGAVAATSIEGKEMDIEDEEDMEPATRRRGSR